MKNHFLIFIGTILFAGIVLTGCAEKNTEQMLAASGFTMQLADTPEKLEHLKTLDQHQFFIQNRQGKSYYVYVDANHCKCLYFGDDEHYQKYENLSLQQGLAETSEEDSMSWGQWPPWGPWGNDTHR